MPDGSGRCSMVVVAVMDVGIVGGVDVRAVGCRESGVGTGWLVAHPFHWRHPTRTPPARIENGSMLPIALILRLR